MVLKARVVQNKDVKARYAIVSTNYYPLIKVSEHAKLVAEPHHRRFFEEPRSAVLIESAYIKERGNLEVVRCGAFLRAW